MAKNTYFISDLHLSEEHPDITQLFLKFIEESMHNAEALYILGDLFDAWIGDDYLTEFHQTIIDSLKSLSENGVKLYFMHGNRDFLIGKRFAQMTGCTLLADFHILEIGGQSTLLLHGDTLCLQDIAYQNYRKKARNPILKQLFLWLPLYFRKKIALGLRHKSQSAVQEKPQDIMDVDVLEVQRIMNKYQVTQLIHGHTHRPQVHEHQLKDGLGKRVVLGAWDDRTLIGRCDEHGCYLEKFE